MPEAESIKRQIGKCVAAHIATMEGMQGAKYGKAADVTVPLPFTYLWGAGIEWSFAGEEDAGIGMNRVFNAWHILSKTCFEFVDLDDLQEAADAWEHKLFTHVMKLTTDPDLRAGLEFAIYPKAAAPDIELTPDNNRAALWIRHRVEFDHLFDDATTQVVE